MTQTPGQRTASTVLDLIDGAIGGDTSPDAMRWTAEPEPAACSIEWLPPGGSRWIDLTGFIGGQVTFVPDDHIITRVTEV